MTLRFSKTEAALERLNQAITQLEAAAAAAPAALTVQKAGKASAMPDLFGDDELTRARQDYARLDQASRVVETRLDAMADRLQTLLETAS